jgi:hypothetical protein
MIDCVRGGRPGAILASGEILHLERAALPGSAEAWLPRTLKDILRAGDDGLMIVRGIVSRVEGMSGDERAGLHHGAILPSTTPLLARFRIRGCSPRQVMPIARMSTK